MTRRRSIGYTLVVLATSFYYSYAQQTVRPSLFKTESLFIDAPDSIVAISPSERKSTTTAVLLSAALPGGGQVYTERYWKIPIIWGFGIYFGSQWNKADNRYSDASDRYTESLALGAGGDARARYERDFYRDERDRFAFYLALTYFLNLVDAYVGASLYEFDVSDDLGGNAELRLSIPIR
ncbi:MAG TPA: DUF5683 domain-containing protein [Bacteroidota bacterium]